MTARSARATGPTSVPSAAPERAAAAAPRGAEPQPALHTFELAIWERAERWQFYETMRDVSEQAVRSQFARAYGRGYTLLHVHCLR